MRAEPPSASGRLGTSLSKVCERGSSHLTYPVVSALT